MFLSKYYYLGHSYNNWLLSEKNHLPININMFMECISTLSRRVTLVHVVLYVIHVSSLLVIYKNCDFLLFVRRVIVHVVFWSWSISARFSRNSELNTSEFVENFEETFLNHILLWYSGSRRLKKRTSNIYLTSFLFAVSSVSQTVAPLKSFYFRFVTYVIVPVIFVTQSSLWRHVDWCTSGNLEVCASLWKLSW